MRTATVGALVAMSAGSATASAHGASELDLSELGKIAPDFSHVDGALYAGVLAIRPDGATAGATGALVAGEIEHPSDTQGFALASRITMALGYAGGAQGELTGDAGPQLGRGPLAVRIAGGLGYVQLGPLGSLGVLARVEARLAAGPTRWMLSATATRVFDAPDELAVELRLSVPRLPLAVGARIGVFEPRELGQPGGHDLLVYAGL